MGELGEVEVRAPRFPPRFAVNMVNRDDARDTRLASYPILCCCLATGCLLTVILLPLSFSKIEYYEAGLLAQKSTGQVNIDKVYGPGNHFVGPDFTFKTYPISLQLFDQRVSVWSKSGGDDAGATLDLDISFQYKIRSAEIGKLYEKVAMSFEPLVVTFALDAIKNTAPNFGVDEYLTKRQIIEEQIKANVTKALKHDIFVDVIDLQLRQIQLSDDYQTTKLNAALQKESNDKEQYIQTKTLIEEQTSLEVLQIDNAALVVEQAALADASLIRETADFQAKQLVETRRSAGLKLMLELVGLQTDEHKASLDYITTLINNKESIKPYVNLDSGLLQKVVQ